MATALQGIQDQDSTHNFLLMTHPFNWNAADYLNTIVPVERLTAAIRFKSKQFK